MDLEKNYVEGEIVSHKMKKLKKSKLGRETSAASYPQALRLLDVTFQLRWIGSSWGVQAKALLCF